MRADYLVDCGPSLPRRRSDQSEEGAFAANEIAGSRVLGNGEDVFARGNRPSTINGRYDT